MFNTLHLMFMEQYTELWNALDAIAERIRSLGYPAPGTNSEFARLTSIEETAGVPEAMDMVRLLVSGHEAVARTARKTFPVVDKAGDESTADLLTQRLQVHEKTAWMLRSAFPLSSLLPLYPTLPAEIVRTRCLQALARGSPPVRCPYGSRARLAAARCPSVSTALRASAGRRRTRPRPARCRPCRER